jgi:hypothetical protein
MVNIYRAKAEEQSGQKLGTKRGKTTYFNPDEQDLIRKVQLVGVDVEEIRENQQKQSAPKFETNNSQAEEGILGGMDAIVQAGDRNALQIGQTLGQRWNSLLWTAALQTMQTGMVEMQAQFDELHTSVSLGLTSVNQGQLTGSNPNALEAASDEVDFHDAD